MRSSEFWAGRHRRISLVCFVLLCAIVFLIAPCKAVAQHSGAYFELHFNPVDLVPFTRTGLAPPGKLAAATAVVVCPDNGVIPIMSNRLITALHDNISIAELQQFVAEFDGTAAVQIDTDALDGRYFARLNAPAHPAADTILEVAMQFLNGRISPRGGSGVFSYRRPGFDRAGVAVRC